jgi:hypothetical protein
MRTMVASTRIAVAMPSPVIITPGEALATKLRKTTAMISAAR